MLLRFYYSHEPSMRWRLLTALGLGVLAAADCMWLVDQHIARWAIQYAGYWLVAATALLFVLMLWQEVRAHWAGWRPVARHWPGVLIALLGAIFWQLHEPHDFKVIFDEHVLADVARGMHYDREGAYRAFMHLQAGQLISIGASVDKRPLMYPFLVSVAHDVTGYRVENSFLVNAVLGFVLLGLVYAIGLAAGGKRVGYFGQLLLIGLPLLAQNATGGGFDLLNATMLCALLLAAWNYWRQPGTGGLDLFVFTGLVLANVRYESLLYLGAVAVVALLKWERERRFSLTWAAALSPALALPPLLVFKVFTSSEGNFQTSSGNFLSPLHFEGNVGHALNYLFAFDFDSNSSALLSAVGVVSVILTAVVLMRRLRASAVGVSLDVPLFVMLFAVLFNTYIALFHFWGQWDRPEVARFSLPLQMAFAWCAMFVAVDWLRGRRLPGWVLAATGLYAVVIGGTISQRATMTIESPSYLGYHWARPFVLSHAGENTLVITRADLLFTVCNQPNIPYFVANLYPKRVFNMLRLGLYREILVVQECILNQHMNTWVPYPTVRLDQRLVLQTIAEFPLETGLSMRVSRLVAYDPNRPAGPLVLAGELKVDTEKTKAQFGWDYTGPPTNTAGLRTQREETEPAVIDSMSEITDFFELQKDMLKQYPQ